MPSFDDELAFAIMEEELGRSLGEVFSSISEHPIAAASLGQVCSAGHPTLYSRSEMDALLLCFTSGGTVKSVGVVAIDMSLVRVSLLHNDASGL